MAGLRCTEPEVLERLLVGRIPSAEAGPLEEHLARCPRCDALADRLAVADPLVTALRAGSPLLNRFQRLVGR